MTGSPISTMPIQKRRWILVLTVAISLATVCRAAEKRRMRTWTDYSGTFKTEAALLDFSAGKVKLQKADGEEITISISKLSVADRDYIHANRSPRSTKKSPAKEPTKKGPSNEVDFGNLLGKDTPSMPSAAPVVREAVVTGVGVDAEKAEQDAFRRAIEQTVGVLVDSETMIKNDEIIKDQVLTFSRAYVQEYDVVKRWQENELHQVTIRATVSVNKLAEKLQASNIAVSDVSGLLMARQAIQEVINEQNAAEIFRKAMADYRIDKLTSVEMLGKPEVVDKDETHARVKVAARLLSDQAKWKGVRDQIQSVLSRVAVANTVCSSVADQRSSVETFLWKRPWKMLTSFRPAIVDPPAKALASRLGGEGILVSVFLSTNVSGEQTRWHLYRVPKSLDPVLVDCELPQFNLVYTFLGADGSIVHKAKSPESIGGKATYPEMPGNLGRYFVISYNLNALWLGPLMWDRGVGFYQYLPALEQELVVDMELEKLKRVVKCAAFLEEVK